MVERTFFTRSNRNDLCFVGGILASLLVTGCVRTYSDCPTCGDSVAAPRDSAGQRPDGRDLRTTEAAVVDTSSRPEAGTADAAPLDAVGDLYRFDGHVACQNPIISSEIEVVFDHYAGSIEELTYKLGSKQNVIDATWNYKNGTGLGRLLNEGGSKLAYCKIGTGTATLEYVNYALYGKKRISLTWDAGGVVVEITISNLTSAGQEGSVWKPGGDNDTGDWVRVVKPDLTTQDFPLVYPGNYQKIWSGLSLGVALWDDDQDEAFGYRYPAPGRQVTMGNGMSADGPNQTFPAPGTYSFSFAMMKKADLLSWLP